MTDQADKLHTQKQAANILSCSESFLAKKRVSGDGPSYIKIGRAVRYPQKALSDYQKIRTRQSTSQGT